MMLCVSLRVCVLTLVTSVTTAQVTNQYLRCYKRSMDKVLCGAGYEIQVTAGYYADNGAVLSCNDGSIPGGLCKAGIGAVKPSYWEEIKTKCNRRRACSGLVAQKEATHCNSWVNPKTDYVLLEYRCNQVTTTTISTSTTTTTTTSTTTTTASTTTITTTPAPLNTTSDVSSYTVSGNDFPADGSNTTDNNTIEAPPVTQPAAQVDNDDLALKIALPLILIVLVVAAVIFLVIFMLRKRRKTAKESPKTTNINGGDLAQPVTQSMTIYNATYENAETLPIRRNNNPDPDYVYDKPKSVRLESVGSHTLPVSVLPTAESDTPASVSDATSSLPTQTDPSASGSDPQQTYMDMSLGTGSTQKLKAWFKNRVSKKGSKKKKQSARSAEQVLGAEPQPGAETTPDEPIYSEPNHQTKANNETSVYSLERERRQCTDSCSSATPSASENHYAVSPVLPNPRPDNEYITMNDTLNNRNPLDRPVSVFSGLSQESEHYSEVMDRGRLENMDGVYSSPRNSETGRTGSGTGTLDVSVYDVPQSPRPVPSEAVYENFNNKQEAETQDKDSTAHVRYNPSVTSETVIVDNASYV